VINIVTAFSGEARPLIDFYRLTDKETSGLFPLFRNGCRQLVISGPGKIQAAAATAWLQGLAEDNRPAAWLNIGIAGHASRTIGSGALANRITDHASGRNWYPPHVHGLDLPTERLLTVDLPETGYRETSLYDMEASGFYPIACRSTTAELVHCYKVVSDNRMHTLSRSTASRGSALVADRLAEIDVLIEWLGTTVRTLSDRRPPLEIIDNITEHWYFSVAQRHRLLKLIARWQALLPEQPLVISRLQRLGKAGDVLDWLERRLDSLPVKLG
jgi:hypothetical protein